MNVNFGGRTYSFEVKPGPDGYRQFTEAIRRAFTLPEDSELNITFTCDEPSTGEPIPGSLLTLQGAGAYDAAVHCASVSAARRISSGSPLTQGPLWSAQGGSAAGSGPAAAGAGGAAGGAGGPNNRGAAPPAGNKLRLFGNMGRRIRNAMAELFGGSGAPGGE